MLVSLCEETIKPVFERDNTDCCCGMHPFIMSIIMSIFFVACSSRTTGEGRGAGTGGIGRINK